MKEGDVVVVTETIGPFADGHTVHAGAEGVVAAVFPYRTEVDFKISEHFSMRIGFGENGRGGDTRPILEVKS